MSTYEALAGFDAASWKQMVGQARASTSQVRLTCFAAFKNFASVIIVRQKAFGKSSKLEKLQNMFSADH